MRLRYSTFWARPVVALSVALLIAFIAAPVTLAAAPSNDTWAGRTAVASLPFGETLDTTEATTDTDDVEMNPPDCGAPATDASVWYEYTPTADEIVIVDVFESDYSAGVLVSSGSPGGFSFVTCGPGEVVFVAEAGVAYSILAIDDQLDGGGNGGMLTIDIYNAPPPPTVDLTVNRTGAFNQDGSATISGTVTCTGEAFFGDIYVNLTQRVGRFSISGDGYASFDCDGTIQDWSATVYPYNGLFKGGRAASVTVAFACGFLCGEAVVEQTVFLRK